MKRALPRSLWSLVCVLLPLLVCTAIGQVPLPGQDADHDGLPDGWEITHGLNPQVDDAQSDQDHDGASALLEYRIQTSPTVADSAMVLVASFADLVALWPFRSDLADASGNGLDLVASGHTDLSAGNLVLASSGWLGLSSVPDQFATAEEHAFSIWCRGGGNGTLLSAGTAGAKVPTAVVRMDPSGQLSASVTGIAVIRGPQTVGISVGKLSEGWHHVVLCWGRECPPILYVDGRLITDKENSDQMFLKSWGRLDWVAVGAEPGDGTGTDRFTGTMGPVGWFHTALEMQAVFHLLAAGWDFKVEELVSFDGDADGLPDRWECKWLSGTGDGPGDDSDEDGLTNLQEYQHGCQPGEPDTDRDGVPDGAEVVEHHTNPLAEDTDGDGLTDRQEIYEYHTNPCLADTDQDGLNDRWEVENELSPTRADTDGDGTADGQEDEDEDGLTNIGEQAQGTSPRRPDVGDAAVSFLVPSTHAKEANAVIPVQVVLSQLPPNRKDVVVSVVEDGGTATLAKDFQFTPTVLTFSEGHLTKTVEVRLLADIEPEGQETVILQLTKCQGARIAKRGTHAILIANSLDPADDTDQDGLPDAWEKQYFKNLAQGPTDDPDKDGMDNLEEYRIGSRPNKGFRAATPEELKLRVTGMGR